MTRIINIRAKMGILIIALVIVIANAIMQAMAILSSVERELAELDAETSAALAANGILAQSDEELAATIARIRLAPDAATLESTKRRFAQTLDQTSGVLSLLPVEDEGEYQLLVQLKLFGNRMARLSDARQDVLRFERELNGRLDDLRALVSRLDANLAVMKSELFGKSADSLTRDALRIRTARQIQLQALSDSLTNRVSDIVATGGPARKAILADANARMGELIRSISTLEQIASVRDVAVELGALADMISISGPLVQAIERLDEARSSFDVLLSDVDEARRTADRLTADTAKAAGASIQARREAVFAAEWETRRRHAIWLVGIVMTILLVIWWVTDRRIVRRIETLTTEMQRVASGDLDTPVRRDGRDEIGQMADALAVFRLNAIELRRSNEELGNFAYAASHDLRSPLRAIRNLVDWTIEDAGDLVPADVLSNLEMIRARADRLSRLLTDLLDYARAGSGEMHVEVIHLPGLVRDIADLVDPDRKFEISFSGDRCIATVRTPLHTILLNLVSNAIKHHDRPSGVVTINHEIEGGRSVIVVGDDGPGVPEPYQNKVFDLFQTLRSSDEVEGSGMGLAMVRKLVGELGGTITLQSLEDAERGAKFIIAIPVSASVAVETVSEEQGERGKAA